MLSIPGEVITSLGGLAVLGPYAHYLTAPRIDLPATAFTLWALGSLLIDIYFVCHPKAGHARHKHVISDIIQVSYAIRIVFFLAAVLAWSCVVKKKLFSRQDPGMARSDSGGIVGTIKHLLVWVALPATLVCSLMALAKASRGLVTYPTDYLLIMTGVGCIGSVLFAAGCVTVLHRCHKDIDPTLFLVQTLGFLLCLVDILFIYKVVDWAGMSMIAMVAVASMLLCLVGLVPSTYEKVDDYELLDNDHED